jgi:hypothetical protein
MTTGAMGDDEGLLTEQDAAELLVCTLAGERISAMTLFDKSVLARFGLPRTLPD